MEMEEVVSFLVENWSCTLGTWQLAVFRSLYTVLKLLRKIRRGLKSKSFGKEYTTRKIDIETQKSVLHSIN